LQEQILRSVRLYRGEMQSMQFIVKTNYLF
jgi:hypothetical protein